ncbi:MAG TPA: sulfatase-like hydrolase/transferase [Bacteriovoracaceae bacterium]|nr:sulfatase-like hydrolase/transferase [Bacteriovoracaceae bacterium]
MQLIVYLLLFISAPIFAYDQNVIFITWDGVRPEDFFSGRNDSSISTEPASFLGKFHKEYAPQGIVLGDEASSSSMSVSNDSNISFPAYLSMMNGIYTDYCHLNQITPECLRNPIETLPERVLREKTLDKSKVAVFASWDRIKDAAESTKDSLVVSAGPVEFHDPNFPGAHDEINRKMHENINEWHYKNGERDDASTFNHAMTYIRNNQPKFIWIYLVETDDQAHGNNYPGYVRTINENEQKLEEVISTLSMMGEYGKNTSIVITTDHGRGQGPLGWMHHGNTHPASRKVWAFIKGPATKGLGNLKNTHYSHLNLRPTMERFMGLEPNVKENVIKEAF